MMRAMLAGDLNLATALNERLKPLQQDLFVESNPIPIKWLMADEGLIPAGIRLPLTTLSSAHHDRLRKALAYARSAR
jgi:4-hydroxy-tetrahydrodipicolinate synthase